MRLLINSNLYIFHLPKVSFNLRVVRAHYLRVETIIGFCAGPEKNDDQANRHNF